MDKTPDQKLVSIPFRFSTRMWTKNGSKSGRKVITGPVREWCAAQPVFWAILNPFLVQIGLGGLYQTRLPFGAQVQFSIEITKEWAVHGPTITGFLLDYQPGF